jgi:lipid II:glycine glycyltransferase (peptidoglycan interpeptide bridge formation enzyme)
LLGATTPAGAKTKASYLLHWRTLLLSLARGLSRYDLGGIDPIANAGVYAFKRGMGGADRTAAGPFELAPRGGRARLTSWGEAVYRSIRTLRERVRSRTSAP